MTNLKEKATLTLVIFVLVPYVINGVSLDLQVLRPDVTKENISSSVQTQEQLEEVWKAARESLYTGRKNRRECLWPFHFIAGTCLHFGLFGSRDWESARKYCWSLDADLGSFGDLQELLLLMGYMDGHTNIDYWIGGSRYNSTSDFQWIDGSSLPDTSSPLWNYNDGIFDNCVIFRKIHGSYKLTNTDCQRSFDKVCKLL